MNKDKIKLIVAIALLLGAGAVIYFMNFHTPAPATPVGAQPAPAESPPANAPADAPQPAGNRRLAPGAKPPG